MSLNNVSFMEGRRNQVIETGDTSVSIPELQVALAIAWILPAPQIQFVPRISFPHELSLCPVPPIFRSDTARFPATQGQNLFLIPHIPQVAKSSCSVFVLIVSLELLSSSASSLPLLWPLHPYTSIPLSSTSPHPLLRY